ncbi:hypothetical protein SuUB63_21260 [Streptococcus uberis]
MCKAMRESCLRCLYRPSFLLCIGNIRAAYLRRTSWDGRWGLVPIRDWGVRFHNGAAAGLTLWPGRSVFVASLQVNAQFLRVYP